MHYTIHCDAGSKGNPGYAYGSYQIKAPAWTLAQQEMMLDESATCNQAEFMILIEALKELKNHLGAFLESEELTIYSDSKLLIMTAQGKWKLKNPMLLPLRNELLSLLKLFRSHQLHWTPRETMLTLFGH